MGNATKEQRDRWIRDNPRKNAEAKRAWRNRNKEKIKEYSKAYKSRDHVKESNRLASRRAREKLGHGVLVRAAKYRSKKSGIEFSLSEDAFDGIIACQLCGIPFERTSKLYAASIDRIDNSKGYTAENCRLILNALNLFKSNGTDEDMLRISRALLKVGE